MSLQENWKLRRLRLCNKLNHIVMIKPAERLSSVNEYYFSNKLKEIEKLKESGLKVLNLGIGNPDLPPSEEALNILKETIDDKSNHGYQSYNGNKSLRSAFAGWYKQYFKIDLNPENEVLPLIGSKEGIMHISMAFLNPGDGVLIPNPSYPAYRSVSELVGASIFDYDLTEENGWFPDFKQIEKLDLNKIKMMWVNYPNMPTGKTIGYEEYKSLIDFGKKHNILICNDNPYSFILNKEQSSIFQIPGAKDIAIELNSMSKSHNIAGWRIGVLIANEEFVKHVLKVKSNVDSGMFLPLQLAAAKALHSSPDWYENLNTQYKRRRIDAEMILNKLQCEYSSEQAGMFVWAKIPKSFNTSYEFTDFLLKEYALFITPGEIFGSNGMSFIRISLASKENDLIEAKKRVYMS
jgi:LL-diaminopimelate aminotransferase